MSALTFDRSPRAFYDRLADAVLRAEKSGVSVMVLAPDDTPFVVSPRVADVSIQRLALSARMLAQGETAKALALMVLPAGVEPAS